MVQPISVRSPGVWWNITSSAPGQGEWSLAPWPSARGPLGAVSAAPTSVGV